MTPELDSAAVDPARTWRVLADGRGGAERPAAVDPRRVVVTVAAGSLLALLVLLAVAVYAGHRAAQSEALRDVRATTELLATAVLAPAIDDAALRGDAAALQELDRLVRERVLVSPVVRIKVWTPQGRIVYSDQARLIGEVYPLSGEEARAVVSGVTTSGLADLGEPEHRLDGLHGPMLEVYTPVRTTGGRRLLVETYSAGSLVSARQDDILRMFLPIILVALVLLQLTQLPLAWSLVRQLRARQHERERLLTQAISASDDERRRIAGDLHDTVVQGLVGTSYVLTAAEERLARGDSTDVRADLRAAVGSVRQSVRGLRSLLLEIYPAHVARAGLSAALEDLVAPLRLQGMTVDTDIAAALGLRRDHEALVFRTAQEALRNVARHSGATSVSVRLTSDADLVTLDVEDDGRGFDVEEVLRRADGHVGLRVLQQLVLQAQCRLSVSSVPDGGTRLRLEVPRS